MLTLIHQPMTRSGSMLWLLEELGVPYEIQTVSIKRADGTGGRDPNNPHPLGKVPALLHDGQLVFETPAIALYLTDLFPEKKLGPQIGDPKRGEYLSWLSYRTGVFEPAFLERRFNIDHVYGAMGWGTAEEVEATMNDLLSKRPYILGDEFTAADIVLGGGINFMMMFKTMNETPLLKDYCARITDRPAFKRMMELDAPK